MFCLRDARVGPIEENASSGIPYRRARVANGSHDSCRKNREAVLEQGEATVDRIARSEGAGHAEV